MRNFLLGSLLLPVTLICAEENHGVVSRRSLFTYTQSQGLSSQVNYRQDIVVLKDGTLLSGEFVDAPSLQYDFGKVPIELKGTTLISRISGAKEKWQVLTSSGMRYIALLHEEYFTFTESVSDNKGVISRALKRISANDVDFALLKPREHTYARTGYQLTFTNGDELPVNLVDKEISINNGWKKRILKTGDFIDVSFNGGLHGTIRGNNDEEIDLGLSFVDSPHISVSTLNNNGGLRLFWKQVAHIREVPKDGFFDINQVPDLTRNETEKKDFPINNIDPIPLLVINEQIEIPEIDFQVEPAPLLVAVGEIEIPAIDFQVEPAPLLATTGEIEIPDINFQVEPAALLAVSGEIEIPEIAFQIEPDPMLVSGEDILIPDINFIPEFNSINTENMLAFSDEIDFGEIEVEGGRVESAETPSDVDQVQKIESEDESDIIFISEGSGEKEPFLIALGSKDEGDAIGYIPKNEYKMSKSEVKLSPANPYDEMQYIAVFNAGSAGFYIQKKKVTNKEYQRFVHAVNYRTPPHWAGGEIPPGQEDEPVVNVTYKDTLLYSVWAGKSLPTAQEIATAASHDGALADRDDYFNEWTSTPYYEDVTANDQQAALGARIGETLSTSHIIHGKSSPGFMHNSDYNAQTGFRLSARSR